MQPSPYLHEHDDFIKLIRIVAGEQGIRPELIEKDYWIMHCLNGLTEQGLQFELKGGTSLSKGFGIIQRFSEDIDVRIDPSHAPFEVFSGPNHQKEKHLHSRSRFYDWLAETITIHGVTDVSRDHNFDDDKLRGAGLRLTYPSSFDPLADLKQGILLEVGFDDTYPNESRQISSWAFDKAADSTVAIRDNRAPRVPCYHPGYTLVEKLQAVSTKFRQQQARGAMPPNFMRHYYDISQLLSQESVVEFIGTTDYKTHKRRRFRKQDNPVIADNPAFTLSDPGVRQQYEEAYQSKRMLYFGEQVPLPQILGIIRNHIDAL